MASYPTPAMNDLQSQNYLQFLPPSALGGVPMNMQMPSNQSGNSQMHSPMMASPGMPPGMQQMLHHFPMPPQGNAYEQYHHHMAVPGPSAPPVPPSSLPNISMGPSSASAYPASPVLNSPSAAGTIRKRRFSSAKIQPTRVKKVMQSDEEIGRMVASVPVAIGRAMEHFAEKFLMASSAAVYGTNGRTLAPAHMKLAMMANPHFAFLEPLLKDIGVPARQANDIPFAVCQTPMPAPIPSPTMPSDMGMCLPPQMAACSATSAPPLTSPTPQQQQQQLPPAPVSARRSSSGPKERPDLAPGEKPKRGRPRKIKKVEKCIDDELANLPTERELMPPPMMLPPSRMNGVCETGNPIPMVGGGGGEGGGEQDKDRCLMPPPSLPISPRHALHNQNTIAQNGTDGLLPGDKE